MNALELFEKRHREESARRRFAAQLGRMAVAAVGVALTAGAGAMTITGVLASRAALELGARALGAPPPFPAAPLPAPRDTLLRRFSTPTRRRRVILRLV